MVYSTANNSFKVTQLVEKVMFPDFVNSLGTTALARPYTKFNGNPTLGTTVQFLYPMRLLPYRSISLDLTTQNNNIFMRTGTLSLTIQDSVPFAFDVTQLDFFSQTADNAEFDDFYLESAAVAIGNDLNAQVLAVCEKFWPDAVGNPQAPLDGQPSLAAIDAQFSNMAIRRVNGGGERYLGLHPDSINTLQSAYPNYFNQRINTPIMEDSRIDKLYGMTIYEDNNMILHTNGTFDAPGDVTVLTTVPLTTTINDSYTLITLAGFTPSANGVLNQGDLISFDLPSGAPVNSVNPLNYQAYQNAKKFYVIGSPNMSGGIDPVVNADGSGHAAVAVYSPIVANPADPYRNVSDQVVATSVVNLFGGANTTYRKNFAFNANAFFFANPMLASYPDPNTPANSRYSAFPTEVVRMRKIPGSNLRVSLNVSAQGDIGQFNNQFVARTFAGAMPLNGYGMTVASAV